MRIAFGIGGTDFGRSGLGVWTRAVLPRLRAQVARRGGSVIVLGEPADLEAYAAVLGDAPRVVAPRTFGSAIASALWYLGRSGRAARGAGADVLLLAAANRRAAARAPLPVVSVVHDFANFKVRGQSDPLRNAYRRLLVLRALRTSSRIVAVSNVTKRDVLDLLGGGAPPIGVVPNGVDADRFVPRAATDPVVAAACGRAGLRPDGYVLYAARFEHPQKNHVRLVAAFARSAACAGLDLALAGGDWGSKSLVEHAIARAGVRDRVRFLGFVPDDDMPPIVAGARAVAMVGLHEGFGLPALEALAAGRPVVASSTGALPEVVGDLAAPCDPMSERSITAALDRALSDVEIRRRAAEEGPAWARARSWDATVEGLLSACEAVTGARAGPELH